MGIFNNELVINSNNPFLNDKLHRESEIKSLTSLFDIVGNQMVLAINSKWGTGKSSFMKMWNQYLANEGYKTIFFNAWENDYIDDPFIAFVNELVNSINSEDKIKGFVEKAKAVGLALVKQTPHIASVILKNKVGFDSEEFISNDKLEEIVTEKIDNYNKNKNTVEGFKKELNDIAQKSFDENNKPIIIFVDELDRCRPDYAISLLERIKHFFNVQNIIFVLGIDKDALSNSIKVIYGGQTDINGYLTRFIDMEYKLKEGSRNDFISHLIYKYKYDDLFEKRKFQYAIEEEYKLYEFSKVLISVTEGFELSLRDIEKLMIELYMIIKANIKYMIYPFPLIMVCTIKRISKSLYSKMKLGDIKYIELIQIIESYNISISQWIESYDISIFKAYLIWLIDDVTELEKLKKSAEMSQQNRFENNDVRCVELFDWIINKSVWLANDIQQVKKKIYNMADLYDSFETLIEN